MKTGVVIVAGGRGVRLGGAIPKQFMLLAGRPVLAHTIDTFCRALPGAEIVVVLPAAHIAFWQNLCARFDTPKHRIVEGGDERFYSVRNGIEALSDEVELIAIHDGVRPLASAEMISRTVEAAATHGAAIPVLLPVDSYRQIDVDGGSHRIDRSRLRIVQTPQVFHAAMLREAYRQPYDAAYTDDASVVEAAGHTVFLAEGEARNLKITVREDLRLAEAILAADAAENEEE